MAATRSMTIEEVAQLPENGSRFELLDGELIALPLASSLHGATLTNVAVHIGGYIRTHHLGAALSGGAGFVLVREPGTLLRPDFAYVGGLQQAQLAHSGPFIEGAPDLVIEIIDEDDLYWVVEGKIVRYLATGVSIVWLLEPQAMSITACDVSGKRRRFVGDEVISCEPIIPGLNVRTVEFFS